MRTIIVNASTVLSDGEIARTIPAFQTQIDRDFMPAWGTHGGVAMQLEFMSWSDYQSSAAAGSIGEAWLFYLNRHSADPGALGWHTAEGKRIFGRVFVGDCIHAGIAWTSDLSHELLETGADPDAKRAYQMRDGRLISIEICDAVESDAAGYDENGVLLSNFNYPDYYSEKTGAKYDHRDILKAPAPELDHGGYAEIFSVGRWGQIEKDRKDGLRGRRAIRNGWRRLTRHRIGEPEILFAA